MSPTRKKQFLKSEQVDALPPWHPDREWLLVGEVPSFIKYFFNMDVSAATVGNWTRKGRYMYDSKQWAILVSRKLPFGHRKFVRKQDLMAFLMA